ncbi:MAG: hypothetical protein VYA34_00380 [Myxococcota bacterium]|nr:hypothetical protein [Myxococcota bacterium]
MRSALSIEDVIEAKDVTREGMCRRAERLDRICSSFDLDFDYPLFKGIRLDETQLRGVKESVEQYLADSLIADGVEGVTDGRGLIEEMPPELVTLGNRTPNGLVLPKVENIKSFNAVHASMASMSSHFLNHHASGVHLPLSVRIVGGKTDVVHRHRNRATSKFHSDVWAAEPSNGMMVFLTLGGDLEKSGIEFVEPDVFPGELIAPLNDFSNGAELAKRGRSYDIRLEPGCLYFSDPYLLHRTSQRGGPRLSLDFRFLSHEILDSDHFLDTPRLKNYISVEDWLSGGTDKWLSTSNSFRQFRESGDSSNSYSGEVALIGA